MRNRHLAIAGLLLLPSVHARAGVIGVLTPYMLEGTQRTGGGWVVKSGSTPLMPSTRSYTASLVGGAAQISAAENVAIATRATAPLTVAATQTVGMGGAASAVGRCLIGAVPLCAAAGAAYGVYSVYRIFNPSQVPGSTVGPSALDYDPGQSPSTTIGRSCSYTAGSWTGLGTGQTAADACSASAADWVQKAMVGRAGNNTVTANVSTCNAQHQCQVRYIEYLNGNAVFTQPYQTIATSEVQGGVPYCPASIDASNPAYSIPAGGAVGPDGKCPTARYNHVPMTADEAAAKVVQYPPTAPNITPWGAALKEAIEVGKQTAPSTIGTTGPATQTGPTTTTTTTPTGGTSTTTNSTATYNYTYAGDTITYNETNSTTNNEGTTTTTGPPAEKAKDPCGLPDTPACKIDETGTPSGVAATTAAEAALAEKQLEATEQIRNSTNQTTLPSTWGWAPPVGACSAFSFNTNRLGAFSVDPCSSTGVALWRTLLAWYLASMTILYVWRSGVELKSG